MLHDEETLEPKKHSLRQAIADDSMNIKTAQQWLILAIPIATALCAGLFFIANAKIVMEVIAGYAFFIVPGYMYFSVRGDRPFLALVYGAPLGIGVTGLVILVIVAKAGWHIPALLSGYMGMILFLAVLGYLSKRKDGALVPGDFPVITVSVALLVAFYLLTVITVPFSNAGVLTDKGYAFTGLFGHDYILRALTAVALSHGIPPDNYYYAGMKMHNYYFLWYTLPAFVYNLGGRADDIRKIVSVVSILNIPFFFSILLLKLAEMVTDGNRGVILKKGRLLLAVSVPLFFCSYHWVFFLLKWIANRVDMALLNAVADQMSYTSQSWTRILLFEPQFPLAVMMLILVMTIIRESPSCSRGIVLGLLLSGLAMTDLVVFLIFAAAYAVYWIWGMSRSRNRGQVVQLLTLLIVGVGVALLMYNIGIFAAQEYSNKIVIKPSVNTMLVFVLVPMELGFLFVWGMMGSKVLLKRPEGVLLVSMMVVSLLAMAFVTEALEGNVFLRKGLYLLTLPLFLAAGHYLYNAVMKRGMVVLLACALLAFPTVVTDMYALMDTNDETFTTYISREEMAAAQWLRQNTPYDAVVQSRIDYPGHFDYSLTVCFGERRAALAHWKIARNRYPNKVAIDGRVDKIRRIFQSADDSERLWLLDELGIGYLFVGEKERSSFPGCEERIKRNPSIQKVYANDDVRVYRVMRTVEGPMGSLRGDGR